MRRGQIASSQTIDVGTGGLVENSGNTAMSRELEKTRSEMRKQQERNKAKRAHEEFLKKTAAMKREKEEKSVEE